MMRSLIVIQICLSFCFLTHSPVIAQVSIEEFIRSAEEDFEVKTYSEQLSYLGKKPYRLSPLRELEFRTQNRELLQTQQEYALRVSPANPWEMRANSRYYKNVEGVVQLEKEIALKDALVDRYYTIIEYLYYSELKELHAKAQLSLEQQLSILSQQTESRYFDADEFAELKVDQLNFSVLLEEYDYEVLNQVHRIERMYPQSHQKKVSWTSDNILDMAQLSAIVDSMVVNTIQSTLLAYQQQKIKVAQAQYKLEKSNINLGFFQGSYDRRRFHQERTPYNFSLGVTIPVTNPNKGDMTRRKLQMIEAEYDLKESESESITDKVILEDKLLSLLSRYHNLKTKITDLEKSNFAQTLSSIKGGDPLLYVQFNERIRKLDILLLKIKRNILQSYVDYLAFTDRLQKQPMLNYLSPQLSPVN